MKTGLVLEGGALRGLYSMGIVDVLMEKGIDFGAMVGVSAGAALGCNLKSRQPGRALRYNTRFAKDWRYCSLRSLVQTGDLFGAEFAYHTVPDSLDLFDCNAFDENPLDFWVVCTDVESGEAVYKQLPHADYEAYEWIRASASMPLCSRVVELEGRKLLDGGVADSIPLRFMEDQGYARSVVILTQPADYVKRRNRFLPLMRLSGLRKYPKFIEAVAHRHEMYNEQLEYVRQREKEGSVLVFRPPFSLPIGHISHDPEEMQKTYAIGRAQARDRIAELQEFIAINDNVR